VCSLLQPESFRNGILCNIFSILLGSDFLREEFDSIFDVASRKKFWDSLLTAYYALDLLTLLLLIELEYELNEFKKDLLSLGAFILEQNKVGTLTTYVVYALSNDSDTHAVNISKQAASLLVHLVKFCNKNNEYYPDLIKNFRIGSFSTLTFKVAISHWLNKSALLFSSMPDTSCSPSSPNRNREKILNKIGAISSALLELLICSVEEGPKYSLGHCLLGFDSPFEPDAVSILADVDETSETFAILNIIIGFVLEYISLQQSSTVSTSPPRLLQKSLSLLHVLCSNDSTAPVTFSYLEQKNFQTIFSKYKYESLQENFDYSIQFLLLRILTSWLFFGGIESEKSVNYAHQFIFSTDNNSLSVLEIFEGIRVDEDHSKSFLNMPATFIEFIQAHCLRFEEYPVVDVEMFLEYAEDKVERRELLKEYRALIQEENTRFRLIFCKTKLLNAWRQLLEVSLDIIFETSKERLSNVIICFLPQLLSKLNNSPGIFYFNELSRGVLCLIWKLRLLNLTESNLSIYNDFSPRDYHKVFDGLLNLFRNSALDAHTKCNLYASILNYLQLTSNKVSIDTPTMNVTTLSLLNNGDPLLESLVSGNQKLIESSIASLIEHLFQDLFCDYVLCRILAFSTITVMLLRDRRQLFCQALCSQSGRPYLKQLLFGIVKESKLIVESFINEQNNEDEVPHVLLMEAKLALLLSLSRHSIGARTLLELDIVDILMQSELLIGQLQDDRGIHVDSEFTFNIIEQSRSLSSASLRLLSSIFTTLSDSVSYQQISLFVSYYFPIAMELTKSLKSLSSISKQDIVYIKELSMLLSVLSKFFCNSTDTELCINRIGSLLLSFLDLVIKIIIIFIIIPNFCYFFIYI
jgi:hypothetical protein